MLLSVNGDGSGVLRCLGTGEKDVIDSGGDDDDGKADERRDSGSLAQEQKDPDGGADGFLIL